MDMVDNAAPGSEGKPGYSRGELQRITISDLKARIGRIDSQQARNIALKLWQLVERQYSNQYGQLVITDRQSMAGLDRWPGGSLARMLERLRHVDFGDIIAAGPQELDAHLDSLHPFIRFIQPPASVRHSFDSAERLARYLEFYLDPQRRVPETFKRSWIFAGGMLASYALPAWFVYLLRDAPMHKGWLISGMLLLAVLGTAASTIYLAGYGQRRILALYISFTDEFVSEASAADDSAG